MLEADSVEDDQGMTLEDVFNKVQEEYFEDKIDRMEQGDEFSESESGDDDGHLHKGAAQYFKPEKKGTKTNDVDQNEYFSKF